MLPLFGFLLFAAIQGLPASLFHLYLLISIYQSTMAEALTMPLSVDDEKARKSSLEDSQNDSLESIERIREIDPDIERRVLRKCDWWVVPAPTVMFMLSFIDR